MQRQHVVQRLPVTTAVLLCGGTGSRLGAIGRNTPKCLLRVTERPILLEHISLFSAFGVTDVYLVTGALASSVRDTVRNERLAVATQFVHAEGTGTGGAIVRARAALPQGTSNYWVSMADIACRPNLALMYQRLVSLDAEAVILGTPVRDTSAYGVLVTNEQGILTDFREKQPSGEPGLVDAGFYLFTRSFMADFEGEQGLSLEYDVFPKAQRIAVVPHLGPWYDIGSVWRLRQARKAFARARTK